jgi:hypothetical protein
MVSTRIAALDAWLVRAEEVLAEQREHAISPSLGLLYGEGRDEWTITLAALSDGLVSLLESLCARPGRWILIVEPVDRPHLFWQALAFEDGSLCTEVVSNHYLHEEHQWTRSEEERLLTLGWEWHIKPYLTNWINVQATTTPDVVSVADQALRTLKELFAMCDDNELFVKMFLSSIRGHTPASPQYSLEDEATPLP